MEHFIKLEAYVFTLKGTNFTYSDVAHDFVCHQLLQEGKALKLLATASRLDIEDFLQKKVYLEVPTYHIALFWIQSDCSCDHCFALRSGHVSHVLSIIEGSLAASLPFRMTFLSGNLLKTGGSESQRELEARRRAVEVLWIWGTN